MILFRRVPRPKKPKATKYLKFPVSMHPALVEWVDMQYGPGLPFTGRSDVLAAGVVALRRELEGKIAGDQMLEKVAPTLESWMPGLGDPKA